MNVAARLESVNKQLGTRIWVSETVADQITGFAGRPAGNLFLKGKSKPLGAFEPLSVEQSRAPANLAYLEAYRKLEAGDPGARQASAALIGQYEDVPLGTYHLQRLLVGESGIEIVLAEK